MYQILTGIPDIEDMDDDNDGIPDTEVILIYYDNFVPN